MSIRDLAKQAADSEAEANRTQRALTLERQRRQLKDDATAWCAMNLIAPDEVIVEENTLGPTRSVFLRLDDIWLCWRPDASYWTTGRTNREPGCVLIDSPVLPREHSDGHYVIRSMATLGRLLPIWEGGREKREAQRKHREILTQGR